MRANGPRGVANLDPRGMVGMISFSLYKSVGANEPQGVAN